MSILSDKQAAAKMVKPERLSKLIARAGICSRRMAEQYIDAGRVRVGDEIITNLAYSSFRDSPIYVDDKRVQFAPIALWCFHKPSGFITTRSDEKNRQRIFDCTALTVLEAQEGQLVTIGRLDMNSEGLLLLTNDGALAGYLEKSDWKRTYRARIFGRLNPQRLERLKSGVTIDGVRYAPSEIIIAGKNQARQNQWLEISIREGKNREVKKMIAWCGGKVNRLIRVSFGGFALEALPVGEVRAVSDRLLRKYAADFFEPAETNRKILGLRDGA